jgi:putative transposase
LPPPLPQTLAEASGAVQDALGPDAVHFILDILASQDPERFRHLLATLMNMAMLFERDQFVGAARYAHDGGRTAYANGYKARTLKTTAGTLDLMVPQTSKPFAGGKVFYPSCLERGIRSDRALMACAAELYVSGTATRKVENAFAHLGLDGLSSTQVSKANADLDPELKAWREQPLGEVPALILDAKYEKTRIGGIIVSAAVLVAIGLMPDGRRTILGVSIACGEAEVHWRHFLQSLTARGMCGVRIIVSDAHSGLKAAAAAVFPSVPWQRCQFHLAQNAQGYVPRIDMRKQVGADLRQIFHADTHADATAKLKAFCAKYAKTAPKLAQWAEANVPEGLTVLAMNLPLDAQKYLRTSNSLERGVNQEIERRTRTIRVFTNEACLLRLVSAILLEIDQQWADGKRVYIGTIAALKSPQPTVLPPA